MTSIPALCEKDLGDTIEGEFGTAVVLKKPEGDEIYLTGFVRRSYADTREGRGNASEKIIVNSPVVKLRISSLPEIPATGQKWLIGIPESPLNGAGIEWYDLDPSHKVMRNDDRGTVKLYLTKLQGSAA